VHGVIKKKEKLMKSTNNVSKMQGILLTTVVLLSGVATIWGFTQWETLTDLPAFWRLLLLPLPLLVFMGMKRLQARQERAAGHE
jgi:hypothetical protein